MLCTPPAFILSQDQTLEKIISYLSCLSYNLFSSYSFLASFTLLSIYNSFDEICTLLLLCTYLLLFNFQWPFAVFFATALLLYHTCFPLSIPFLKLFLSFFRGFLKSRLRYILPRLEDWWAIRDSNPGPTGYEPVALTNWANGPNRRLVHYTLIDCICQEVFKIFLFLSFDIFYLNLLCFVFSM